LSNKKRANLAALTMLIVGVATVQQRIAEQFFSGGRGLGQQHISTQCNRALTSKVMKEYNERTHYLSQHGRRT